MTHNDRTINYFAETEFRNARRVFGIKDEDRAKHIYIIGKTGMGKSTLLLNMAIQDIRAGKGVAFLDPDGRSAEKLLEYVPKERIQDVVYIDPPATQHSFKKVWSDVWSSLDIRTIMDGKKILIVNLSKGRIGDENTAFLGGILMRRLYRAAMSRATYTEERLSQFYIYTDEFQFFANETFPDMVSHARKYNLSLIIAHQYLGQIDAAVQNSIFGNVGTTISFQTGPVDAHVLEKVFSPAFSREDIISLGAFQICQTLRIDGKPFLATTLPPVKQPDLSFKEVIIEHSRKAYVMPERDSEEHVGEWFEKYFSGKSFQNKIKSPLKLREFLDQPGQETEAVGSSNQEESVEENKKLKEVPKEVLEEIFMEDN